ncbi:MAG: glycosyltransferase family 9 protein [Bacteroides sp.]|nr:glycosyltransferase family 9 protein [Bacteroides sp.]MBO5015547.1 glycosyltransferase family 9 protein [Bacteroidaceae bacterium]
MKLLAIRFSAFGDVAMTVPVIHSVALRYPELEITVLSKPSMQPLFGSMPQNVCFRGVDLKQYKGIGGLWRLYRELKKEGFEAVADLHDVLRSKVLRTFFRLSGKRVSYIDKGRAEKKALVRAQNKQLKQLPTSFQRYEKVFSTLGYPVTPLFRSLYGEGKGDISLFEQVTGAPDATHWVGIAPFAAHRGKILPEEKVEELISRLTENPDYRIFLFGGGKEESRIMEKWAARYPRTLSLAGRLKLSGELALMSHLDVMISMDSANMHLASLTATPVVSVWGATHPFAGFMGWNQRADNAVQVELSCRPCSIFGNKPCLRGDFACLREIKVENVVKKVETIVSKL